MKKQICAECSRSINLRNEKVDYILKTSRKARRMRLAIYGDGSFVATKPRGMSDGALEKFIIKKANWVLSKLAHFKKTKGSLFKNDREDYLKRKKDALALINERIEHFNKIYNFKFNRISVRNQRTRWGSCSARGNLNFNYKILSLPRHIADYIVVHELCHLGELNHSRRFWDLVGKTIFNYKEIRRELRKRGLGIVD